jgi:hypothetical protein
VACGLRRVAAGLRVVDLGRDLVAWPSAGLLWLVVLGRYYDASHGFSRGQDMTFVSIVFFDSVRGTYADWCCSRSCAVGWSSERWVKSQGWLWRGGCFRGKGGNSFAAFLSSYSCWCVVVGGSVMVGILEPLLFVKVRAGVS